VDDLPKVVKRKASGLGKVAEKKPAQEAADGAWHAVLQAQASKGGITTIRKFGTESLSVRGKVIAMNYKGNLVVKLPKDRVADLLRTGLGEPFILGRCAMREWVAVSPRAGQEWPLIAEEARAFVADLP
jgi:hypothetical protein